MDRLYAQLAAPSISFVRGTPEDDQALQAWAQVMTEGEVPPPKKGLIVCDFSQPSNSAMPRPIAFTRMVFLSICSHWLGYMVAPSVLEYPPPKKGSLFQSFPN